MTYSRMGRLQARVTAFGVVAAQIVAGVVLAGFLAAGGETRSAYSVLAGMLAGVAPNFFFALKLFGLSGEESPAAQLRAIYVGQAVKMVFASTILVSAIAMLDVSLQWLLGGFLATVLVNWCALTMPLAGEQRR